MKGAGTSRGQAVVELALGLLLFTTVLLFGIHFAEVGFLSLKVQEAAVGTVWDSTAQRMHHLPGNFQPLRDYMARGASAAGTNAYGKPGKAGATTETLTQASAVAVQCGFAGFGFPYRLMEVLDVYREEGMMACNAQATLSGYRIPQRFADGGGGMFRRAHYQAAPIRVCGVGRLMGSSCPRGFQVLLDDWGLAGYDEANESPVDDMTSNPSYYQSAARVFRNNYGAQTTDAKQLAVDYVGVPEDQLPMAVSRFRMSFRGEESQFIEPAEWQGIRREGAPGWATSPGANSPLAEYREAYEGRGEGFLGTPVPPAEMPNPAAR